LKDTGLGLIEALGSAKVGHGIDCM
jgi:hypothetical protein